MTVLVATGLKREQRLLAGPGANVFAGGGDSVRLEEALERSAAGARGIISVGIAGGLSPDLRAGQWTVATAVLDKEGSCPANPAWTMRLLDRLPGATKGLLYGADAIMAQAAQKADLHRTTGAIAVDMESHVAARVAVRHRLPFVAARVVSDAAHRSLPTAACVGLRADGAIDLLAVLRSILQKPGQLGALILTGLEAERAFRALLRGRDLLGPGFGLPDVG